MGLKTEYSNIKLKKSKKQTYKIIGMLDLKVRISCFETQENQFPLPKKAAQSKYKKSDISIDQVL